MVQSYCSWNAQSTFVKKPLLKMTRFRNYELGYRIHTWSDKAFKGTVLNRASPLLYSGSIEIPLTVPLKEIRNISIQITFFFILCIENLFVGFTYRSVYTLGGFILFYPRSIYQMLVYPKIYQQIGWFTLDRFTLGRFTIVRLPPYVSLTYIGVYLDRITLGRLS